MKKFNKIAACLMAAFSFSQLSAGPIVLPTTNNLSPVLPQNSLPFKIKIKQASFSLPTGLQSFASGICKDKWVIIAGRTNGLHGFADVGNNFPPSFQNTRVYVIDPKTGKSHSRSLTDGTSGLTQTKVDSLSTTASEFTQIGNSLYIVGGYGINTKTGQMETKSTLTKINLEQLVHWVKHGTPSVRDAISQVSDPFLQVTGGALFPGEDETFLLMLGQNFQGLYFEGGSGTYTQQIRRFKLVDHDGHLKITSKTSSPILPENRRRDLNIVPTINKGNKEFTAFAGVFTPDDGVWTVPITISRSGTTFEANPTDVNTFKQAMNQYICPAFGLYSSKSRDMYEVFPGGLSFGFFSSGVFQTDTEIPFINQVTTVKIDKDYNYTQYLMDGEYPVILAPLTGPNAGNALLFGTGAEFFPASSIPLYKNGVIKLDKLPNKPVTLGYIAGGIMSTVPNTTSDADSTSSPYVFTVELIPNK